MHQKLLIVFSVLTFLCANLSSQTIIEKYWLYLADKENNSFSLDNPLQFLSQKALDRREGCGIELTELDIPVSNSYLEMIAASGVEILHTSRWFNAVAVAFDIEEHEIINELIALPFVTDTLLLEQRIVTGKLTTDEEEIESFFVGDADFYGPTYNQISMLQGQQLHENELDGSGITIAVFDAGFDGVDQIAAFDHIFDEDKLLSTQNITDGTNEVFGNSSHGTFVLSTMAAYLPDEFVGVAPGASYRLFVTEYEPSETHMEEVNWLVAAERADAMGVDIINSSLNYIDFGSGTWDYTAQDMDGQTTIITRAAEFAASKGILVVSSAGNAGGSALWDKVSAPADGPNVLSVGLVNENEVYDDLGSVGPTADGRLKPEVSAQGILTSVLNFDGSPSTVNGTSYSAPLLAGLAACLWQCNRDQYCASDIRAVIIESSSQYNAPDNLIGYGIPDFTSAHGLLSACSPLGIETEELIKPEVIFASNESVLLDTKGYWFTDLQIFTPDGRLIFEQKIEKGNSQLLIDFSQLMNASKTQLVILSLKGKQQAFTISLVR